jgi:hypothetical protein
MYSVNLAAVGAIVSVFPGLIGLFFGLQVGEVSFNTGGYARSPLAAVSDSDLTALALGCQLESMVQQLFSHLSL